MSAEREVFKQIDKLVAGRDQYLKDVTRNGRELIRSAVREVMLEHPEILALIWSQNFTKGERVISKVGPIDADVNYISRFCARIDDKNYYADTLTEINPQLSKCLAALESKCRALPTSLCEEYGEEQLVCVLQPEQ